MVRKLTAAAIAGLVAGGVVIAIVAWVAWPGGDRRTPAGSAWSEVQWPFPIDQFGKGKAFQCSAAECGTKVTLYVRAKIGFCNCATGVADDEELTRISDFELFNAKFTAIGDGRPIAVAWMKGRSRSYTISASASGKDRPAPSALAIGYNDRCDAIVATALVQHDRPGDVETAVIAFLNGPIVMRWAEMTLGL